MYFQTLKHNMTVTTILYSIIKCIPCRDHPHNPKHPVARGLVWWRWFVLNTYSNIDK
jgi:hypothetical protein